MKATKDMMVTGEQLYYETVDEVTRNRVIERVERIESKTDEVQNVVGIKAWEIGMEFSEIQKDLAVFGHGTFTQWINFGTRYSKTDVYRFINIYKRFSYSMLEKTSLPLRVLFELAQPSTPEDAIVKAFEKERNGEKITSRDVTAMRKDAKGVNSKEAIDKGTEVMDKYIWEDTSKDTSTGDNKERFDYSELVPRHDIIEGTKRNAYNLERKSVNIDDIFSIGYNFENAQTWFMFHSEDVFHRWIIGETAFTIPFAYWSIEVYEKFYDNEREIKYMSFEKLAEAIGKPMPTIYQFEQNDKQEDEQEEDSVLFSIGDTEDSEDTSFEDDYELNEFDVSSTTEYDMNEFDVSDTASVEGDTNTTSFAYDGDNTETLERIILNNFDSIPSFKLMIMNAPLYNTHSKSSDVYNALGVLSDVLHHAYAKAQENSTVMFFADNRYVNLFRQVIEDAGFTYRGMYVWVNSSYTSYECIIHAVKGNPDNTYQHNSVLTGKIFLSSTHPNKKPVDMLENIITSTTNVGDVVIDAFGGNSDTFIASEQTNRVGYAFEVDENCYNSVLSIVLNEQENIKY